MNDEFDEWWNEVEGFALRGERLFEGFDLRHASPIALQRLARVAFDVGYHAGFEKGYASGLNDGCVVANKVEIK